MIQPFDENYFMRQALQEAEKAAMNGEVPIGAVIVSENRIIARAHNQVEQLNDVTAHAEIMAITAAAQALGTKYLNHCQLYITLEPCIMCAGAIYWSQLGSLIYGAEDEKRGFMREGKHLIHPKTTMKMGLLADECREILQDFFVKLRA